MSRKKVLHVIQSLDNGGCENMLLRTLPLINEFENKIFVLKELGDLAPQFKETGISVQAVNFRGFFDIAGMIRLRKMLCAEKPDLVVTYLFHADLIGRLFVQYFCKIRVIPFLRTTYNHPRYFIARVFERMTKRMVGHYFANSEAVKSFYVKNYGISKSKIEVIPNGMNVEKYFQLSGEEKAKKRVELGLLSNDFIIICVANLAKNKGHKYLLDAFEGLYNKYVDTALLIVGDGEEKENLLNQVKSFRSYSKMQFLGRRTDVPDLLAVSDVFVLPTLFEGMSNAVLEAMVSGVPVITTNIDENKELIRHNYSGLLFECASAESIKEQLELLFSSADLRANLGQNSRSVVFDNFLLSKTARKFEIVIKKHIEFSALEGKKLGQ